MQSTPYDHEATMTIHAKCDTIMKDLIEDLGIQVNSTTYKQEFAITCKNSKKSATHWDIILEGTRYNEPCKCVESVSIENLSHKTIDLDLQADLTFQGSIEANRGETLKVLIEFKPNFHE